MKVIHPSSSPALKTASYKRRSTKTTLAKLPAAKPSLRLALPGDDLPLFRFQPKPAPRLSACLGEPETLAIAALRDQFSVVRPAEITPELCQSEFENICLNMCSSEPLNDPASAILEYAINIIDWDYVTSELENRSSNR